MAAVATGSSDTSQGAGGLLDSQASLAALATWSTKTSRAVGVFVRFRTESGRARNWEQWDISSLWEQWNMSSLWRPVRFLSEYGGFCNWEHPDKWSCWRPVRFPSESGSACNWEQSDKWWILFSNDGDFFMYHWSSFHDAMIYEPVNGALQEWKNRFEAAWKISICLLREGVVNRCGIVSKH